MSDFTPFFARSLSRSAFTLSNKTVKTEVRLIKDENGTDTTGYRVIPYPTLMYFYRIQDQVQVVKFWDGYKTGPGNNPGG
jgi:hypothetical protein